MSPVDRTDNEIAPEREKRDAFSAYNPAVNNSTVGYLAEIGLPQYLHFPFRTR